MPSGAVNSMLFDVPPDGGGKEASLHPDFPDFDIYIYPTKEQVARMEFKDLIGYLYSRACKMFKTEKECRDNNKLLNVDALQKYKKDKKNIDVNFRIGGIPLLHLICRCGVDRYHPHAGQDKRPISEVEPKNKLLLEFVKNPNLEVNAVDGNGSTAITYVYSYGYEVNDETGEEGYMVTTNWVDARTVLELNDYVGLDFPVPGGCLFRRQLIAHIQKHYMFLYPDRHERNQYKQVREAYGDDLIECLRDTVNQCGSELERAARARALSIEKKPDKNRYEMTLLNRCVSKVCGWGPSLLVSDGADEQLISMVWALPNFDKEIFLEEYFNWEGKRFKALGEEDRGWINATDGGFKLLMLLIQAELKERKQPKKKEIPKLKGTPARTRASEASKSPAVQSQKSSASAQSAGMKSVSMRSTAKPMKRPAPAMKASMKSAGMKSVSMKAAMKSAPAMKAAMKSAPSLKAAMKKMETATKAKASKPKGRGAKVAMKRVMKAAMKGKKK